MGEERFIHLLEDIQVWETIDPDTQEVVPEGERGITVCMNLNSESSAQLRFVVGDYTRLAPGLRVRAQPHQGDGLHDRPRRRPHQPARDQVLPVQIEEAVRAIGGTGDEFQIRLTTRPDGLDVMTVVVEHADPGVADTVAGEVRTRCEIRADVEVVAPDTLPKTEMKAKRVLDERGK